MLGAPSGAPSAARMRAWAGGRACRVRCGADCASRAARARRHASQVLLPAVVEMSPAQRVLFRNLLTPHCGVPSGELPQSVASFFARSLQPVAASPDRVFVDSELVRAALETLLTERGELVPFSGDDERVMSMRSHEHLNILADFGDILTESLARDNDCVKRLLEAMVERVGAGFWRDQSAAAWFEAVMRSPENTRPYADVQAARSDDSKALPDAEYMRMYFRLWRNSAVHAGKEVDGDAVRWQRFRAMPAALAAFADDPRLRSCMHELRLAREKRRSAQQLGDSSRA